MKAVILAGGNGRRLNSLTNGYPKQLLLVGGKSILSRAINQLLGSNISNIAIIGGDTKRTELIRSSLKSEFKNLDLTYIEQDKPLGTAHALSKAKKFVSDSEKFLVLLGDNVFDFGLKEYVSKFQQSSSDVALVTAHVSDPENYAVLNVVDGKLMDITEKPKIPNGNKIATGLYFFSNRIFDTIDKIKPSLNGELELTSAIQLLLVSGHKIECYEVIGPWFDIGTPNKLLAAKQQI